MVSLRHCRLLALLTFALLSRTTLFAQSVPQVADGKITGAGFTLTVSQDLMVQPGVTDEAVHGFYIDLARRASPGSVQLRSARMPSSYRYIAFDTKWDTGDMPSLDSVVNAIIDDPLDHIPPEIVAPGNVALDSNLPTRVGGLPARRLVLKYKNTEKHKAIRHVVVAYNARPDASAVVYIIVLNTTEDNFQEDVSVFSKLLAGFKLTSQ